MSHMEDDDPPIKSHPASKEYRDNFDRIFGEKMTPAEEHEHYIASGEIPGVPGSGDDADTLEIRMGHALLESTTRGGYDTVFPIPAEPRVEAAGNTQITEPGFVEACRKAEKPWERRAIERGEECKDCGAKPPAHCDGDIHARLSRYSCTNCCDTGCVVDPTADEISFVTEADGLVNCPECSIRGKQLP